VDRIGRYFEHDARSGSFARAAAVGRNGSSGMRARWRPGQVNAGALHLAFGRVPAAYFRTVDAGARDYREIHWRLWVRHSLGWSGGGAGKLTRAIVFGSSGWATAVKALVWSGRHADPPGSHPDQHFLVMEPTSGTSAAGKLLTTAYSDGTHVRWLGSTRGVIPLFAPDRVEGWHCVEVRVRLNTPGRSDGAFEVWVDGALDAGRADLGWVGTYGDYGINAIFLENYWNAGAPAAQERYLDDFVVSTERIGCGG
jgi:hypothetical protein